jgi:hypothetical protein
VHPFAHTALSARCPPGASPRAPERRSPLTSEAALTLLHVICRQSASWLATQYGLEHRGWCDGSVLVLGQPVLGIPPRCLGAIAVRPASLQLPDRLRFTARHPATGLAITTAACQSDPQSFSSCCQVSSATPDPPLSAAMKTLHLPANSDFPSSEPNRPGSGGARPQAVATSKILAPS